jgi:hypothetical protein
MLSWLCVPTAPNSIPHFRAGPTCHARGAHPFIRVDSAAEVRAEPGTGGQRDGGSPVRGPAGARRRWLRQGGGGGGGARGGVRHGPWHRRPPLPDLLPHLRPARPPEGSPSFPRISVPTFTHRVTAIRPPLLRSLLSSDAVRTCRSWWRWMGPWWTTAPTWSPSPSACASWPSARMRGRMPRLRMRLWRPPGRRRSPTRSSRGCFRFVIVSIPDRCFALVLDFWWLDCNTHCTAMSAVGGRFTSVR